MSYMLLIIEKAGVREERSEAEGRELYQKMLDYSAALKQRGLLQMSQALRTEALGARVSVREGKRSVVDGPFAEAKEMVGGFFLLNCNTREEALEIAANCPAAQWSTIEVRELGPCFT
jgi:hypothetical protein